MEYAATGDELASYKKAGFKEAKDDPNTRIRARQLFKNEKIQARIDEYQKEAIRKISWTKEKVLEKIGEVYSNSINDGDFTNANRAMENIAKHLGMFVDLSKVEQTVKTTGFESGDKKADIKKLAEKVLTYILVSIMPELVKLFVTYFLMFHLYRLLFYH